MVDEVGVLSGIPPAGPEPHLPSGLVDTVDAAHHPLAARDLLLHLAGAVYQVEVPPAVALGAVDDLVAAVEVAQEAAGALRVGRPQERFRAFVEEVARRAGVRVHLDQAEALVA